MASRQSYKEIFLDDRVRCLLLSVFLSSCTVQLVSPFDEVIDSGLYDFNKAFLQFMAETQLNIPSSEASYANSAGFYNLWQATIDTLVQRAQASDPKGSCPGAKLTGEAMQDIGAIALPKGTSRARAQPYQAGSCTAILIMNIQRQLADTACFHQAMYGETSAKFEASGFSRSVAESLEKTQVSAKRALLEEIRTAVTASVTAAMTFELAKKQSSG